MMGCVYALSAYAGSKEECMQRFAVVVVTVLSLLAMLPVHVVGAVVTAPQAVIPIAGIGLNSRAGASVDYIDYFPSTKLIYLTDGANKSVDLIDPASNTQVGRIPLADVPHQVILDPALNLAAISLSNRTVSVINLETGALQSIDIGGNGI